MAKFDLGEKTDKEEAKKALMQHAAGVFDGRFTVRFESDDGGNHIVSVSYTHLTLPTIYSV